MAVWKDPSYLGSHFFESVLAAEGLDPSDPLALLRVRQAITDAQAWLWQQAEWYWAVSPTSPARFEVFPTTQVVVISSSTTLSVADTGEFRVGDTLVVDEGNSGQEFVTVSAIADGISVTVDATLNATHAIGVLVRKLRPVVYDPSVRTRVDSTSSADGDTVNVRATTGFSVDDIIVIDPGGAKEEIRKIESITDGVSFTIYGNLDNEHGTDSNVYKAVEEDPKFDLTLVNGGVMKDFGRATKVLIDGEGSLRSMNPSAWLESREENRTGGIGRGDQYIIEGDPPQMKFEITPTSNKTVVVHYLRAPTLVHGDDDIQMPWPFHNLLRWCSRLMLQKNGPAGALLGGDQDIQTEIARLRSFQPDLARTHDMRPLAGSVDRELVAAVPGAAVREMRAGDFN